MGNQLVVQSQAQLPAHLQALAGFQSVGMDLAAQASMGGHPRISIKAARFRLVDASGEETLVQTTYLDVIIVDANPNKSKNYYAQAYNPADTEFKAPDCSSNDGIAPSQASTAPQCGSCAACPHNVWGSKITASGAQTKACADSQRLAVVLADNPTGPVYELKVPAASIANIANYAKTLAQRGIPIPGIVTRVSFDTKTDYPKLVFAPAPQGWATPEQVAAVTKVMGTEEVDVCTGRKEHAAAPARSVAPVAAPVAPPKPIDPFDALMAQAPTIMPPVGQQFLQSSPTVTAPVPSKRPRKKAEPAPDLNNSVLGMPPIQSAAQAVPLNVPVTNSALDDLLSAALKM